MIGHVVVTVDAEHVGCECDLEFDPEKDPEFDLEWLVLLQHSTVVVKLP